MSYRRADSEAITGRIAERLVARYGQDQVNFDIDSIPFGSDFRDSIDRFLSSTDVVVVVVGPDWCGRSDGRTRIQEKTDHVRKEVEVVLERKLPIVPVLVGHAVMPSAEELPATLLDFSYRNAVPLSPGRDFNVHIGRLFEAIDNFLAIAGVRLAAPQQQKGSTLRLGLSGPPVRALAELAAVALGVAVLPIGGLYAAMTPASPLSLPVVTVAAALATFLVQFQLLRPALPERRRRGALKAWITLAGLTTIFLMLLNFFTFQIPGSSRRFAAGFACSSDKRV